MPTRQGVEGEVPPTLILTVPQPLPYLYSFAKVLEEDFDLVYRAVSNIDGRRAEAFQKSDQRMIISAVLETVGFTELNALISSRMREWLIEQVLASSLPTLPSPPLPHLLP